MSAEIPFNDLSARTHFPNRFEEDRMWREQIELLTAERDLLVSRLCAIAFEAGMYGTHIWECWDGQDFYQFRANVSLREEEVK